MLNCVVLNHFQAIEKLRVDKTKQGPSNHRQSPTEDTRLGRRSAVEAPNMSLLLELNHATASNPTGEDKVTAPRLQRQLSTEDVEMNSCKLEPRIEGRIVIMTPETLSRLQNERQKWEMTIATQPTQPIKEEN